MNELIILIFMFSICYWPGHTALKEMNKYIGEEYSSCFLVEFFSGPALLLLLWPCLLDPISRTYARMTISKEKKFRMKRINAEKEIRLCKELLREIK